MKYVNNYEHKQKPFNDKLKTQGASFKGGKTGGVYEPPRI